MPRFTTTDSVAGVTGVAVRPLVSTEMTFASHWNLTWLFMCPLFAWPAASASGTQAREMAAMAASAMIQRLIQVLLARTTLQSC